MIDSDSLCSKIMEEIGFCGCGMPEDALSFIRGGLLLLKELRDNRLTGDAYDAWDEKSKAYFNGYGGYYFFYYWCDKQGLTEHGGSVPGWLDEKGEEFLIRLNEWHVLYESENS